MKRIALIFIVLLLMSWAVAQDPSLQIPLLNAPQRVTGGSAERGSGNPGPRALYYWVVTNTIIGSSTPAGPFAITTAPNVLDASNTVQVSWIPDSSGSSYDVLRTNTSDPPKGACNCAVATGVTAGSAIDNSESLLAYTVTPIDPATYMMTLSNEGNAATQSQLALHQGKNLLGYLIPAVQPLSGVIVVDGLTYANIAAAQTALPAHGGVVVLPNGYTETITSTLTLGDGINRFVTLSAVGDATLTCNVTDGSHCFVVKNGSGIVGAKVGRANTLMTSGFIITYPATINVATVITSDAAAVGGQGYITLERFFINGQDAGGTISTAVVNIENVLGQAITRDFYVTHFNNTIGLRVASSTGGAGNTGTGPLEFINVWVDGNHNVGARPFVAIAQNGKGVAGITFTGGTYNHPGAGLSNMEFNGNGQALGIMSNIKFDTYIEKLSGAASAAVSLRDVTAVNVAQLRCLLLDTDTCVDISESAANRTAGIYVAPGFKSSPTNAANWINNHITGDVIAGASNAAYSFGGESGTSQGNYVVAGSVVQFRDLATNVFTIQTTGVMIGKGVGGDGSGFKHKRVAGCATAASVGAVCTTSVTWGTTFADGNYTATCSGDLVTSGVPVNGGLSAKAAGSVTWRTAALTAAAAQYTTIDCVAVHD